MAMQKNMMINSLRASTESEPEWKLRRHFLDRNIDANSDQQSRDHIVFLSHCFINMALHKKNQGYSYQTTTEVHQRSWDMVDNISRALYDLQTVPANVPAATGNSNNTSYISTPSYNTGSYNTPSSYNTPTYNAPTYNSNETYNNMESYNTQQSANTQFYNQESYNPQPFYNQESYNTPSYSSSNGSHNRQSYNNTQSYNMQQSYNTNSLETPSYNTQQPYIKNEPYNPRPSNTESYNRQSYAAESNDFAEPLPRPRMNVERKKVRGRRKKKPTSTNRNPEPTEPGSDDYYGQGKNAVKRKKHPAPCAGQLASSGQSGQATSPLKTRKKPDRVAPLNNSKSRLPTELTIARMTCRRVSISPEALKLEKEYDKVVNEQRLKALEVNRGKRAKEKELYALRKANQAANSNGSAEGKPACKNSKLSENASKSEAVEGTDDLVFENMTVSQVEAVEGNNKVSVIDSEEQLSPILELAKFYSQMSAEDTTEPFNSLKKCAVATKNKMKFVNKRVADKDGSKSISCQVFVNNVCLAAILVPLGISPEEARVKLASTALKVIRLPNLRLISDGNSGIRLDGSDTPFEGDKVVGETNKDKDFGGADLVEALSGKDNSVGETSMDKDSGGADLVEALSGKDNSVGETSMDKDSGGADLVEALSGKENSVVETSMDKDSNGVDLVEALSGKEKPVGETSMDKDSDGADLVEALSGNDVEMPKDVDKDTAAEKPTEPCEDSTEGVSDPNLKTDKTPKPPPPPSPGPCRPFDSYTAWLKETDPRLKKVRELGHMYLTLPKITLERSIVLKFLSITAKIDLDVQALDDGTKERTSVIEPNSTYRIVMDNGLILSSRTALTMNSGIEMTTAEVLRKVSMPYLCVKDNRLQSSKRRFPRDPEEEGQSKGEIIYDQWATIGPNLTRSPTDPPPPLRFDDFLLSESDYPNFFTVMYRSAKMFKLNLSYRNSQRANAKSLSDSDSKQTCVMRLSNKIIGESETPGKKASQEAAAKQGFVHLRRTHWLMCEEKMTLINRAMTLEEVERLMEKMAESRGRAPKHPKKYVGPIPLGALARDGRPASDYQLSEIKAIVDVYANSPFQRPLVIPGVKADQVSAILDIGSKLNLYCKPRGKNEEKKIILQRNSTPQVMVTDIVKYGGQSDRYRLVPPVEHCAMANSSLRKKKIKNDQTDTKRTFSTKSIHCHLIEAPPLQLLPSGGQVEIIHEPSSDVKTEVVEEEEVEVDSDMERSMMDGDDDEDEDLDDDDDDMVGQDRKRKLKSHNDVGKKMKRC